ncbi:hypothetical protein C5167_011749 [Papaver somniferum]|nr:hypothetical protein C5167_011749 [Papaver somniferum]
MGFHRKDLSLLLFQQHYFGWLILLVRCLHGVDGVSYLSLQGISNTSKESTCLILGHLEGFGSQKRGEGTSGGKEKDHKF